MLTSPARLPGVPRTSPRTPGRLGHGHSLPGPWPRRPRPLPGRQLPKAASLTRAPASDDPVPQRAQATGRQPNQPIARLGLRLGVPQRASYLLDRDHAAEAAFGVYCHQGAEAAEVLVREEVVQGRVVADEEAVVVVNHFADQGAGAGDLGDLIGGVAVQQAEKTVGGVDY